jgi:hypothetical protein
MRKIVTPLTAGAAATIIFAIPFRGYLLNNPHNSDMWVHLLYAKRIHSLADIRSPHFLYQFVLISIHTLFHLSYGTTTVLTLALCYGVMAALIAREVGRRSLQATSSLCVVAAVGVLLASHVFLQSAFVPNFYYGYTVPISYHNPTQQMSKLFALAIVLLYGRWFLNDEQGLSIGRALLLAACCVLSALAKPSFIIAFLPAAGIIGILHLWRGEWRRALVAVGTIAIPSMIVLGLQFHLTYGAGSGNGSAEIIWAPFVVGGGARALFSKLPGSLLFPLVVLILAWRSHATTRRLRFTWLLLCVGLAESFLLAESGPRMMQGNLFWTAQTVMFLLYVESMLFAASQKWRQFKSAWAVMAVHVLFGIIFYTATALFPAGRYL